MATKETSLMRCKGPGGYIEIVADYDEITGDILQFRVLADLGAKLIFIMAGEKKAMPKHAAEKAIVSSGYRYDKTNPKNIVLPILEFLS